VNTAEQNGVAERKNRHLLEVARSLMFMMNVPKFLWGEAVKTAAYLINRMPSRVLNYKTPIECLSGTNSFIVPPKVFGCTCFVHDYRNSVGKLDPRAVKCIFLGYSPTQKGYRCWSPTERKFFVSMDVTFHENEPFYSPNGRSAISIGSKGEMPSKGPIVEGSMLIPMINTSQQNDETEGEENTNINKDNGGSNDHEVRETCSPQQVLQQNMSDMSSSRSSTSPCEAEHDNVEEEDVAPVLQGCSPVDDPTATTIEEEGTEIPLTVHNNPEVDHPIALRKPVRRTNCRHVSKIVWVINMILLNF
jgi:hypothetical protein